MFYFRLSVLPRLRLVLLAVSVLLVLGLNQRTVRVLRAAGTPKTTGYAAPLRATVVKQKVLLEATASLAPMVAPPGTAWLPAPALGTAWLTGLRRALGVPRLCAGIGAGAVFRARLLAVALSPQAP